MYVPDLADTDQASAGAGYAAKMRNSRYLWIKLRKFGLTPAGAAGVMGNVDWESRFNPAMIECGGCSYSQGLGLIQWSFGRREAMLRKAWESHVRWYDLGFQVWYIQYEMKRYYPHVWKAVRAAKDPLQAAIYVHDNYEKSNDTYLQVRQRRGKAAQLWYWHYFFLA